MKSSLLTATLLASSAYAQVYVDTSSNYGGLTELANVSPFNVMDEFALPDLSSSHYILGSTTLTVTGQNGPQPCSGRGCTPTLAKTTFNQPLLMQAVSTTNGSPWSNTAPAMDTSGQPVVFTCTSSVKSPCTAWQYAGDLPTGTYTLHLKGASCGGHNCGTAGDSYMYVHSKPIYTYVPPPQSPQ